MDFTSLLAKRLAENRKKQRKKREETSVNSQNTSNDVNDPSLNSKEDVQNLGFDTSPNSKKKSSLLSIVDEENLTQGLHLLNEDKEIQSKEDQPRKLQIHVKQEKKDLRYKAYLEKENSVKATIKLSDIGAQEEEKLRLQIRKFLKEILKIWSLAPNNDFPESILLETKRDIVKLMYKLRSGKLPLSTVVSLSTIVYYIQTKSFVKGNEAYLKLSIGNVAWPIGVRDVGIHARAADAKIAGDDKKQVANIMKSETTRRWLIAVKRIVNYCTNLHENGNDALS